MVLLVFSFLAVFDHISYISYISYICRSTKWLLIANQNSAADTRLCEWSIWMKCCTLIHNNNINSRTYYNS